MIYWHSGVSASDSVEGVLRFSREFLASWSPQEIAHLPETCRPGTLKDVGEIDFWANRLSEEYVRQVHAASVDATLGQFVHFFLHASMRCHQLLGDGRPYDPDTHETLRGLSLKTSP